MAGNEDAPRLAAAMHGSGGLKRILAVTCGAIGALSPLGVTLYEHRVNFLPIRTIEILWPSSLLFLPDPGRRFAVLMSSLSIAANAAIYALAGFCVGAVCDRLRFRIRESRSA